MRAADPDDRMLHVRLQGNTLGVFDVIFDSTAGEQVEAGQSKTGEDGIVYYNVWTSFSTQDSRRSRVRSERNPPDLAGRNGRSGRSDSRAPLRY